jgi:glycosyltransferase involved in cell wall biosynthesis
MIPGSRSLKTVLHIINDLSQGGAETMLYNLLRSCDQYHHIVISLKPGGYYKKMLSNAGIQVLSVNFFNPLFMPGALVRLIRLVFSLRPALIQSWMYISNVVAWLISRCVHDEIVLVWNIRHSLTDLCREKFLTRFTIRINQFLSSTLPAIIYNSAVSAAQHERFGFDKTASRIIPNGFDIDTFTFSTVARKRRRQELAVSDDICLVGVIGRFHPLKDHANFLRAVSILEREIPRHTWRCVLIGRDMKASNPVISDLILRNSIKERLILIDETHDIPEYLSALDVLCSPSCSESFPSVIAEAMSTGLCCVATDVGETAVIMGDTGVLVPPKNARALADGLGQAVRAFEKLGPQRSSAARERIGKNYSLPHIARTYEEFYRTLMTRGTRVRSISGNLHAT